MSGGRGGSELSVIPDEVTALGKYAYDLADILRSALRSAALEVATLTSSEWTGSASDSYATGWNEVHDGGEKIIEALSSMASSLGVTAQTITAHDNQFASEYSSLDLP
ncbi:WXG100 family type VII secretion target [Nocardia sp. NPDC051321]|uniref:WXG100 family type VII secretion target n=1 Tax=Nocardia sp. NPDC051321 TaxID=3364323 RepID=UPI0037A52B84